MSTRAALSCRNENVKIITRNAVWRKQLKRREMRWEHAAIKTAALDVFREEKLLLMNNLFLVV